MTFTEPAVPLTALAPYLGRFVRLVFEQDGVVTTTRGFLTEIKSGVFVVDDLDYVAQKYVLRAYNIANQLIAGEENQ